MDVHPLIWIAVGAALMSVGMATVYRNDAGNMLMIAKVDDQIIEGLIKERDALRRHLRAFVDRARPIPVAEELGTAGVSMVVERREYDAAVAALGGWTDAPAGGETPAPPMVDQLRHRAESEEDWGRTIMPKGAV